jgi:hypothetical protein
MDLTLPREKNPKGYRCDAQNDNSDDEFPGHWPCPLGFSGTMIYGLPSRLTRIAGIVGGRVAGALVDYAWDILAAAFILLAFLTHGVISPLVPVLSAIRPAPKRKPRANQAGLVGQSFVQARSGARTNSSLHRPSENESGIGVLLCLSRLPPYCVVQ